MLKINNLTVAHGAIRAIDDISFSVEKGQLAAVIGSNGAGKTTLMRTLSGLKSAENGTATWLDHNLLHGKPEHHVRQGVSHVSEGKSVIAQLTVEENLDLGALWRRNRDEAKATKEEVFNLFPRLGERRKQLADTLSGGERQMLAIGRAYMSRPALLLLDEPSLGLAPLVVEQIIQTVNDLCRKSGLTVLLVEQNANTALAVADYGVLLSLGKVVANLPAAELKADASLRAAYLGY